MGKILETEDNGGSDLSEGLGTYFTFKDVEF